jgi:hypothetical protein
MMSTGLVTVASPDEFESLLPSLVQSTLHMHWEQLDVVFRLASDLLGSLFSRGNQGNLITTDGAVHCMISLKSKNP